MSTWSHPDELHQTAFIMASFFFTEIQLLNENHLSCSHCQAMLTSQGHTKHSLCEERGLYLGQTRIGHCLCSQQQTWLGSSSASISPSLGERPDLFLTVSTYNSLHGQLFGGFWSRVSCARADFGPVESRTGSTPRQYRQKHPVNLQLPVVFSESFMKWFILQLFPTKKG